MQHGLTLGPKFIYDNYLNDDTILDKVKRSKNANLTNAQLDTLATQLKDTNPTPKVKFNTKIFRQEMEKWLAENNLIIQNSDKNLCITLIDKAIYNNALQQLVNDDNCYIPINNKDAIALVKQTYNKLHKIYTNFRKAQDLKVLASLNVEFGFPNLYLIPKIHKPKLAFRPIVNQRNFIFTEIYKQIHIFWHTKLACEKLKDSLVLDGNFDFLLKIEALNEIVQRDNINLSNYNIISLDVTNLYGNIDLNEIKKCLEECYDYHNKADDLLMLRITETILFNNVIESNNQLYLQKNGLAMGINYAPSLANIYLFHRYDKLFAKLLYSPEKQHNPILFYGRYLDDILIIYNKNKWKIDGFVNNKLNNIHKSIQFTTEFNNNNVINFLDLTMSIDILNNQITYRNFTKPLKSNTMLHAKAAYKQKAGLIKSQSIRLLKNNREKANYEADIELLKQQLQLRGYNKRLIDENVEPYEKRPIYMNKDYIMNKPSQFAANTKDKKRVVLDYHNRINIVKKSILNTNKHNVYFINRNYKNLYNTFFSNRKNTRFKWQYSLLKNPKANAYKFTKQPSHDLKKKKFFYNRWLADKRAKMSSSPNHSAFDRTPKTP